MRGVLNTQQAHHEVSTALARGCMAFAVAPARLRWLACCLDANGDRQAADLQLCSFLVQLTSMWRESDGICKQS